MAQLKTCTSCGEAKSIEAFSPRKGKSPHPACKRCHSQSAAEWKRLNPERSSIARYHYKQSGKAKRVKRAWDLKTRYNLSVPEYDALLKQQGDSCAICHSSSPGGFGNQWHVDHDHASGAVRGLLCCNCNLALGFMQDDPDRLEAAAAFIRQHKEIQFAQAS